MCLWALCAVVLLIRRVGAPLMRFYLIASVLFSQSSLAFILGKVWNHPWWLAHAVFASGFFVLSYGVVRALLTTGGFSADLHCPERSTMLSRS